MYDVILGRKESDRHKFGTRGSVLIGKQYVKMGQTTSLSNNIYLDVANSHKIFIVGKTGSGKSYSMSAIAEGIMDLEPSIAQNISMIMLDTMGVFWTMKYPNKKDTELLREWGIKPKGMDVQIFTPIGMYDKYKEEGVPTDFSFAIQPNELDSDDWNLTFDVDRNSELGVLIERVITMLKDKEENYTIQDIIDVIDLDKDADKNVRDAAKNRFMNAQRWGVFDIKGTKLKDLIIGGKITVLDLSVYSTMPGGWAIKCLVTGLVAKKLFTERMKSRRQEEFKDIKESMDYFKEEVSKERKEPLVWLVLDESHEFIPSEGKTTATEPLVTILREGRQPGISLVLASQQPAKINSDVMTQSDIVISLRLTAKIDTDSLQQLAQSYLREGLETSINQLPRVPGAAIALDDENERIYSMKIRPKMTWHGGSAPSAIVEDKEEI